MKFEQQSLVVFYSVTAKTVNKTGLNIMSATIHQHTYFSGQYFGGKSDKIYELLGQQ